MAPQHWQEVAEELRRLLALIEGQDGPADLNACAKAFARSATAYYVAVVKEGSTSMRLQAVCKALDLKTPKSVLARFLAREERD